MLSVIAKAAGYPNSAFCSAKFNSAFLRAQSLTLCLIYLILSVCKFDHEIKSPAANTKKPMNSVLRTHETGCRDK